jgi:hypothetical protein
MERSDGDAESPTGWFIQCGRRVLVGDSRGFVWTEVWPEPRSAEQVVRAMSYYYGEWSADEWDDDYDEDTHEQRMARADRYLAYVGACAIENLEAFELDMWTVHGEPTGPLG